MCAGVFPVKAKSFSKLNNSAPPLNLKMDQFVLQTPGIDCFQSEDGDEKFTLCEGWKPLLKYKLYCSKHRNAK